MSAGLAIQKSSIDNEVGAIGRDLNLVVGRIVNFKAWLDGQLDADLAALGYNSTDIANMRSALGDAKQLADIYAGTATLGSTKDFRTFLKRIWGLGY